MGDPTPKLDALDPTLRHFVENILGCREDDLLVQALDHSGIHNFDDIVLPGMDLDLELVLELPSPGKNKPPPKVPGHIIRKIELANQIADKYFQKEGKNMDDTTWQSMTKIEFRDAVSSLPRSQPTPLSAPSSAVGSATAHSTASLYSPASLFKKGIKRDPASFPILKQQKYYQSWKRSFVAQAHAQDVAKVLDSKHNPVDQATKDLFRLEQDYMYAVFNSVIQTDKGKEIVRQYSKDRDAQLVFAALEDHASTSTEATLEIQQITTFLTTSKLDGTWRGTYTGYITHWKQQLQNYEDMTDTTAHYSSLAKKRMLMSALELVKDLRDIQLSDEKQKVLNPTGPDLSYDQYCTILNSATARLDDLQRKHGRSQASKRTLAAKVHDTSYFDDGDQFFDANNGADDDAIAQFSAFRAQQVAGPKPRKPWIPMELWEQLAQYPDIVHKWNSYDWNKAPPDHRTPARRSANVHDMVQSDDLAPDPSYGENDPSSLQDQDNHHPDDGPHESTTLLAHVTQTKPASSSEIRDIIAQSHKPRSKVSFGKPSTPSKSSYGKAVPKQVNVLEYDGKRYMEINMFRFSYLHGGDNDPPPESLQYSVSLGQRTRSVASLMDRGANGGFAGADCRLIEQHSPTRYADVTGVGDKKVCHLPLGTYAGLVQSHKGSIILIMHQYAGYHKGKTIHSAGQWEHNGHVVDDKSRAVGGMQRVTTADGYAIPLQIRQGLPCLDMRPPTDEEMDTLPQVIITSDMEWDPTCLDCEQEIPSMEELPDDNFHGISYPFDAQGNYRHREAYTLDLGEGDYADMSFDSFVDICTKQTT